MTANASDRRKSRRIPVPRRDGALEISLDGTVLDISLSGMAIETASRLAPRANITLHLHHADGEVSISGHVVWCFLQGTSSGADGDSSPLYRAGIQFEKVLRPQAQSLADFLSAHAIVSSETRLFGRFRVPAEGGVNVTSESGFHVLELTDAGLVVESTLAIEPARGAAVDLRLLAPAIAGRARVVGTEGGSGTDSDRSRIELEWLSLSAEDRSELDRLRREGSWKSPA